MNKLEIKTIHDIKNFLILWIGQFASQLGISMTNFAIIIWAYKQTNSVLSISMLSVCSYLPYILVSMFAGALVDRYNKKYIMLVYHIVAVFCSLYLFSLIANGTLRLWHVYIVNLLIGFMDAFQSPALSVSITMTVPKQYYAKTSGLQSLSNNFSTIFTPILATALLAYAGIKFVVLIELIMFLFAFCTLLLFVKIPHAKKEKGTIKTNYWNNCKNGFLYLIENKAIFNLILFMSIINLLASMAYNNVLPAMILARTNNNEFALGAITSAIGAGGILGSILVTLGKAPKDHIKRIFNSCALSFLICDIWLGLGRNFYIWALAVFIGNIPVPFLNASEQTVLRTKIPTELQGRVFSLRGALQFGTIPIGYLVGGLGQFTRNYTQTTKRGLLTTNKG